MGAERAGLRILMTADAVGGVWPFAIELSAQLARRGDRILLAAMGREPDARQRRQATAIRGLELHARPYRLVWMRDPWRDLAAAGHWLRELAADFAPDVVHLNDLALAELDWAAPVLTTAHSCVCTWWRSVHGRSAPTDWNPYRARVAAHLRAADEVVAPTRAMLDALTAQHGTPRASRVIHNGRSPTPHAPMSKEPFVLAAGRLWDAAKNLDALAAVAPGLPWPVHLAGETRHPDGGDAPHARLHALGALPEAELRHWMARASIYALPARYEPFGLSALEAAQCGCALVLGDIPSLREVWGDAAIFVAPDDRHALGSALRRLIADDALRDAMAQRARARAQRYSPDAMASGYRDAYSALARCHPVVEDAGSREMPAAAGAHA